MEVKFASTFEDSIKKIIKHNTWWYKTYDLFNTYIPNFVKNVWIFRKALLHHRWYDHRGTLQFVEIGITHIADNIEKHGYEVDESRMKKVAAMRRTINIIQNYLNDNYINMAEAELGKVIFNNFEFEKIPNEDLYKWVDNKTPEEKEHNRIVFKRSREIEEQEWDELFNILKGQDCSKFDDNIEWEKQFDGTGLRGWWD